MRPIHGGGSLLPKLCRNSHVIQKAGIDLRRGGEYKELRRAEATAANKRGQKSAFAVLKAGSYTSPNDIPLLKIGVASARHLRRPPGTGSVIGAVLTSVFDALLT